MNRMNMHACIKYKYSFWQKRCCNVLHSAIKCLLNKTGQKSLVDQRVTIVLQEELLKLLIRKNLILSVWVFLGTKHLNRVFIGHINIKSVRNKIDQLIAITKGNVDVLIISETKLDESFFSIQFNIDWYNISGSDRNANGGGILEYVWDGIPRKLIPVRNSTIDGFLIKLKLRKKKRLLCCSNNTHRRFISNNLLDIGKKLYLLSTNYENILLLGVLWLIWNEKFD